MLKVLELCFSCMGKSKEMLEKQNDWRQVYPEEQSMDDTFATCLGYLANFQRRICLSRCAEKDIPMTDVLTNTHKLSSNHSTREPAKAKKYKSLDTDENEDSCYLISPCEISFEEENDRLHEQHWILKELRKESVPLRVVDMLTAGEQILDALCGPGTYVMDMAVEFPRCRVVGTDRTATFPKDIKPRNAKFIQVDSVSELPFSNKTFAFINVQTKLMLLSINNIYKFLGEMTRLCKVGGYIYFMIPDLEHDYADEIVNHYLHILRQALRAAGGTPSIRHCLETFLAMKKLYILEHKKIYQCIDDTTKFGKVAKANYERWAQTIGPQLEQVLDMDSKQFQHLTEATMKHFINAKIEFIWHSFLVRKLT